jgi:hypothetical protein
MLDVVEKLISLPSSVIYQEREYLFNLINEGSKELRLFYAPENAQGVHEALVFLEKIEDKEDLDWAAQEAMKKLRELEVQVNEVGSSQLIPIQDMPLEPSFFSL